MKCRLCYSEPAESNCPQRADELSQFNSVIAPRSSALMICLLWQFHANFPSFPFPSLPFHLMPLLSCAAKLSLSGLPVSATTTVIFKTSPPHLPKSRPHPAQPHLLQDYGYHGLLDGEIEPQRPPSTGGRRGALGDRGRLPGYFLNFIGAVARDRSGISSPADALPPITSTRDRISHE